MSGKSNPRYVKKIHVKCDYCGKELIKNPSLSKNKNKNGESHNFCCYQCYWNFRSMYYVGDKLYNTGKKMSEDFCNKVRNATLLQYEIGVLDRQTQPQKTVNNILVKNKISYINEKTFKYYSVDNYLVDFNLIIEVMGDYFHANPLVYSCYDTLNDMQIKDVIRDKRKNTYFKKYYKINILYLWESDLKKNVDKCEQLILDYIKRKGELSNYNSFNFHLRDNKLQLNNKIINPYF